jgi:signal transduction histidine kinase
VVTPLRLKRSMIGRQKSMNSELIVVCHMIRLEIEKIERERRPIA